MISHALSLHDFVMKVVPEVRFELTRCCQRRILSPLRLPFRHSGTVRDPSYHITVGALAAI